MFFVWLHLQILSLIIIIIIFQLVYTLNKEKNTLILKIHFLYVSSINILRNDPSSKFVLKYF